jgi:putative endonuclease
MGAYVYILRCADGRYYVGATRAKSRRPVALVFSDYFDRITDAIAAERQLKGWSRAKKEALIAGDFERLVELSRGGRTETAPGPSTSSG